MKTYLHLKTERNDCFQTICVPHKWECKHGYAVGVNPDFVLFNSRWHRIRSFYELGTPYANLRYFIGPKKTNELFRIGFEY